MALVKGLKPKLSELGQIKIGRKGEERQSKYGKKFRAPEKLDHFVITTMEKDALGDRKPDVALMEALAADFGSDDRKLRQLPIALLSDDLEEVLSQAYCYYAGRRLGGRCDGETVTYLTDREGNPLAKPIVRPCNGEHESDGWKLNTTLSCVIAAGGARWGGVYKFRTTSKISAEQLLGSLVHLQQLTGGVLQGLPLMLVVRPIEVAPEGKATTVYVVHVELRGNDLADIQKQAMQFAQNRIANAKYLHELHRQYIALLKAPGEGEDLEEQADIADEFYPESRDANPGAVIDTTATLATDETDSDTDTDTDSDEDDDGLSFDDDEQDEDTSEEETSAEFVDSTTGEVYEGVEAPFFRAVLTAKNADELKAAQDQVKAAKDVLDSDRYEALKTAYYATRERLTGKPPPAEQAAKSKPKTKAAPAPKPSAPAPEKPKTPESKPANGLMDLPF